MLVWISIQTTVYLVNHTELNTCSVQSFLFKMTDTIPNDTELASWDTLCMPRSPLSLSASGFRASRTAGALLHCIFRQLRHSGGFE